MTMQIGGRLFELTKPRLSLLVLFTTVGGLYLAPGAHSPALIAVSFLGTWLVVGGANAFNMYFERDSDALMERTKTRPLPSLRMRPATALAFAILTSLVGLAVLWFGTNPLTTFLGLLALVSYAFVYTPLKKRTPFALIIGGIPGAMPPLMGWTAGTERHDLSGLLGGLILFGIMFCWQIPHFAAIAIVSSEDYKRGGIRVVSLARGIPATKRLAVVYASALVPTSLYLWVLGLAGTAYFVVALVGGLGFLGMAVWGLRPEAGRPWARSFFFSSLFYLTALFAVLAAEATFRR